MHCHNGYRFVRHLSCDNHIKLSQSRVLKAHCGRKGFLPVYRHSEGPLLLSAPSFPRRPTWAVCRGFPQSSHSFRRPGHLVLIAQRLQVGSSLGEVGAWVNQKSNKTWILRKFWLGLSLSQNKLREGIYLLLCLTKAVLQSGKLASRRVISVYVYIYIYMYRERDSAIISLSIHCYNFSSKPLSNLIWTTVTAS